VSGKPDPKPLPRVIDPHAIRRKVKAEPQCRNCSKPASQGHHIIHRSQGGDDRPDNILPLCITCHRLYHDGGDLPSVRFKPAELAYVTQKMGDTAGLDYLRRRYGWTP
jgi:5-methylcytosine-specific restriction endonuclease McrA